MNKSLLDRQPDGTITLTITLPQADISKARTVVIDEIVKNADVPGFRKGKAPEDMVKGRINEDQVRENILKKLLPNAYSQAVQEHNVRPIINPHLHIDKVEEGQDWTITAVTCEMPKVNLGTYKQNIGKLTAKSKIVIPGKEQNKPSSEEVMKVLLESVDVQIPKVLIDQETDRLLAQLLDDIKKLGLGLEQYLATTKRSPDDLRNEYAKRAADDIKTEFVLQAVAEDEKITVDPKEVDEAIQRAKDPAERQNMEANRYLLAGILRQQKTLDFLMNL